MDVLRDQVDVVHDLYGIFENIGVHSLDDVGLAFTVVAQVADPVGFVDVADLDFLAGLKASLNAKRFADLLQFLFDGTVGSHLFLSLAVDDGSGMRRPRFIG